MQAGRSRRRRQDLRAGAPQLVDVWGIFFLVCFFVGSLPRSRVCVLFRSCCIFSSRKSNPSTLEQQKHLQTFTTLKSPKSYQNFTLPFIRHRFLVFLSFAVPAESKNQGEDGVPEEADLQILPCLLSSEVRRPSRPTPPIPWQRELPLSVTVT